MAHYTCQMENGQRKKTNSKLLLFELLHLRRSILQRTSTIVTNDLLKYERVHLPESVSESEEYQLLLSPLSEVKGQGQKLQHLESDHGRMHMKTNAS